MNDLLTCPHGCGYYLIPRGGWLVCGLNPEHRWDESDRMVMLELRVAILERATLETPLLKCTGRSSTWAIP